MGVIEFQVIRNDREPQNMIWLAACKNIFSKQLPKMPKEYIVRLVFDRNHRSLVLLKQNKVCGAITFRLCFFSLFVCLYFKGRLKRRGSWKLHFVLLLRQSK